MKQTRLERGLYWDRAWKLVEGCTKVSPGCTNCWSEREAAMRSKNPNPNIADRFDGVLTDKGKWNREIKFREDNLELPMRVKKPTKFAIWNDLFHEEMDIIFIYKAFDIMRKSPQHTVLILTKRPKRMNSAINWILNDWRMPGENLPSLPDNIWLGVTAENQEQADKRIPILLQIPAAVRYVSFEPMLSEISISQYLTARYGNGQRIFPQAIDLDWVIIGAESGGPKERRIENHHITNLLLQCSDAKVPVFLKQAWVNGKLVKIPNLGGQVWDQFPEGIK